MKSFSEIIEIIKKLKGVTHDYEVAELLNIKQNTISVIKGRNSLPFEDIMTFCHKEGISLNWLLYNEGPKGVHETAAGGGHPQPDSPSDEFIFIRQMRGKISAGGGLEPDDTVDLRIAFRKDWITHKGKPENMSLIKVDGDSMIPTLLNGDLVLVDHGKNYIAQQGGIYAISVNHEIMIKRVQPVFPDGKLLVISDNKQYEPYEIESDKVRINGKVIWFARDMER